MENSQKNDSNEKMITEPNNDLKKPKDSDRIRWIDQGRGFIMLYLVITTVFPPGIWKDKYPIVFWLTGHPGTDATYMTFFDIGAAAFIFVLGILYTNSFYKHLERGGTKLAIKHVVVRYGLIFLLGFTIVIAGGEIMYEKNGYTIVSWDVMPTLGLVGLVAIPFAFLRQPKFRLVAGYLWLILYQILMIYADLKGYAKSSIHGGIYGTIFGYAAIMIVASVVGDYVFDKSVEEKKKYLNLAIFGALNLLIGILIAVYVPEWEASKRQVSFTHGLISIGVTIIGCLVFVYLDRFRNMELKFWRVYGQNPFLTYLITVIPVFILDETIGTDLSPLVSTLLAIILVAYTSAIMFLLDKKKKVIPTEKVAGIFIVIVIILAVILISTGVVEL